jgi:hypothetical protein
VFGIRDRENGLLVNNTTEEWVAAISELIENEKLRKQISDECLKEANEIYALDILADDYLEKITTDYRKTDKVSIPGLGFAKFIIFFKRVFRKIKEQGLNFPVWLKDKLKKKLDDRRAFSRDNQNKERLKQIIQSEKTVFVIAPYFGDSDSEYDKRVRLLDETMKDCYKIYFSGEDRISEHLMVDLIDEKHASIVCNSFDILQCEEVLNLIRECKNCLIHSVIRFMRDKISNDMYQVFDMDEVNVMWDSHGMIPEMYHAASNFHTEQVTADIEKTFYEKADVLICGSEEEKKHYIGKYGKRDMKYIVCPSKEAQEELKEAIR